MTISEKLASETSREYAFRVIQDNIISLGIKPGIMLSEQEIAEKLQISRTPVHEALQELSKSKIIEILPQKGSRVSLIDMKLVNEAIFMRSTIESAIIEEACKVITEKDLEDMEENLILQNFYKNSKKYEKLLDLDNRFHEKLYSVTDKMQCLYMVRLMNIHFDRLRELSLETGNIEVVVDDHKKILQAIRKRDVEQARELLLVHLNRSSVDEKNIRKKFPDYFSD